jgi:hypothetical protein
MSYSILLVVLFGLLILFSIVLLIYGGIRRRKRVLIYSSVMLIFSVAGCLFFAINSARLLVKYVKSDEFQEDTKKTTGWVGETVGSASSGFAEGLSGTLEDSAITTLAGKSASIMAQVLKVTASSLDSTIGSPNVYFDKNLEGTGINFGRADIRTDGVQRLLVIYASFEKKFEGVLRLTNYDQKGKVIEAVNLPVAGNVNEEEILKFDFPVSQFGLTTYFILSRVD